MSTSARQRLVRDLRKITNEPPQGINATPTDSNILVWQAVIFGPDDTPWEGGTFSLMMEFTEEYPNKPPKIRFISKVFHPNGECHVVLPPCARWEEQAASLSLPGAWRSLMSFLTHPGAHGTPHSTPYSHPHPNPAVYADGQICLDILQNAWSPIYDVSAVLTSIQSLLCDPNPNSPANSEAAKLFQESKEEYDRRVRLCVEDSWAQGGV